MGSLKHSKNLLLTTCLVFLFTKTQSAVHDFNPGSDHPSLYRKARDDRYFLNRYGSAQTTSADRGHRGGLKAVDSHPEPRTEGDQTQGTGVEKRCIRCATSYLDPYDYRDYNDRDRHYDRYEDRRYDDRYDYRMYDRYDNRYDRYDRDRWYDRRPQYEDRPYSRGYDRYDRSYDRGYDRTYDRNYDRGFGYDNRGYDNRGYDSRRAYDTRSYRPWDDSARSGYDNYARGYYYTSGSGRPDYFDRGYASGYNYGRDSYRDPYRRDQHSYEGYRGTSYLYDRNPSPQTTPPPHPNKDESGAAVTDRPGVDADSKPADGSGSG